MILKLFLKKETPINKFQKATKIKKEINKDNKEKCQKKKQKLKKKIYYWKLRGEARERIKKVIKNYREKRKEKNDARRNEEKRKEILIVNKREGNNKKWMKLL